jgi:hypothetical protein
VSLHDNVTLGLILLAFAATLLMTIVATSLALHLRHRAIRRQYERIRRWADDLPAIDDLPATDDLPPAPVIQAWWTTSPDELTDTAVLPRMTDDILTAEALKFEVTQVLQTVAWRPANEAVPGPRRSQSAGGRRGHLDVVEGFAGTGRHRAAPR